MEIKKYEVSKNFWETYPEFDDFKIFHKLKREDKRKGKWRSSSLMWSFAAFVDITSNNILNNISDNEKIEIIEKDYISGKFDLEKYSEYIELMRKLLLPREYRALSDLYNKLEERTKLIQDTRYTIENAKKLDELIANTDTLLETIKKMESSIKSGSDDGVVKGGRQETIGEKGLI